MPGCSYPVDKKIHTTDLQILTLFFFKIIPKGCISRIFGYIAQIQLPGFIMDFIIKIWNIYIF